MLIAKQSRILNGFKLDITGVIFPTKILKEDGRAKVISRRWLGLFKNEEVVKLENVASVRNQNKIISATVVIETSGGFKEDLKIKNLTKGKARKVSTALN